MYCMSKVCFMCFNDTDIENYTILQHAGNEIVQQVKFVLPEIAILEPLLPLFICSTCRQALDDFHNFKNTCIKNSCRYNDYVNKLLGPYGSSKATNAELQLKIREYVKQEENIDINIKLEETILDDEIDIKEDFTEELFTSEDNTDSSNQQIFKNETEFSHRQQNDRKMTENKNNSSEQEVTNDLCQATDLKCLVCNDTFVEKSHLQNHMMVHYNVEQRKCFICDKKFQYISMLRTHMTETHTDVKDYKCFICNKLFGKKSQLKRHKIVHTGVKNYKKCSICNKSFTHNSAFYRHMKIHTGVKNYKCSICNKLFSRNDDLKQHMAVHTGVKNYKCSLCNKLFTRNGHLQRHMALHSGVKNYKCSICNISFAQKSNLKKHMVVHTGVRDMCLICNKEFFRKNDLKKHMTIHKDVKEFECFMCNKNFLLKRYLDVHIKRHEKNKTSKSELVVC